MGKFDDFIESATYRLRPDPELRMDVANEVRAHLEDAVDAARDAGAAESDAEAQALRAFGDPEEIAKKLWEANFRRMRLRAVAKWAGRLVLVPAAILLSLWLTWDTIKFLRFLDAVDAPSSVPGNVLGFFSNFGIRPDKVQYLQPRENLNTEERLLLKMRDASLEDVQTLVQEYPTDPVYWAHLAGVFIYSAAKDKENWQAFSSPTIQRGMAIADEGERVEPDNAFWNYYRANLLMNLSGAVKKVEVDPDFTYPVQTDDGIKLVEGYRLVFRDRAMFEQGLGEYRKGLTKPYYRSYDGEFLRRTLALHRLPRDLMEESQVQMYRASTLLTTLGHSRQMTRNIMWYAKLLIDEGRGDDAAELIRTATIPGTQLGSDSNLIIELLVSASMRRIALNQGAALYERMGQERQAEAAREQWEIERQEFNASIYGRTRKQRNEYEKTLSSYGGLLASMIYPRMPPTMQDVVPSLRRAERFFLERAALGVLCLVLLLFVLWFGAIATASSWRHRRDTRGPRLFFVGWTRLCLIVAVSVALPLAAYALWTRLPSSGSAHYGINHVWKRILFEMGFTSAVVLGLSLALAFLAARKRCLEAGIVPPHSGWLRKRGIYYPAGGMIVCLVLTQGMAIWLGAWRWDDLAGGGVITLLTGLIVLLVMSFVRYWLHPEDAEYYGSVRRSMLPVLITVLVILGLIGKFQLGMAERAEIAKLNRLGEPALFVDNVKYTSAHKYQDYLKSLPHHGAL